MASVLQILTRRRRRKGKAIRQTRIPCSDTGVRKGDRSCLVQQFSSQVEMMAILMLQEPELCTMLKGGKAGTAIPAGRHIPSNLYLSLSPHGVAHWRTTASLYL